MPESLGPALRSTKTLGHGPDSGFHRTEQEGIKGGLARGCSVQTPLLLSSRSAKQAGCEAGEKTSMKPRESFGGMRQRARVCRPIIP